MQKDTVLLKSNEEDMRVLVGFKGLIVGHRNSFLQALGVLLVGLLGRVGRWAARIKAQG